MLPETTTALLIGIVLGVCGLILLVGLAAAISERTASIGTSLPTDPVYVPFWVSVERYHELSARASQNGTSVAQELLDDVRAGVMPETLWR